MLEINNTVLSTTYDQNHFGVTLRDDFKWHTHINNIVVVLQTFLVS